MTFKEIKNWAKQNGYNVVKVNESYNWTFEKDNTTGSAPSVSKVAKSIYNHMTHDKFIDYQKEYLREEDINIKNDLF